MKYSNIAKTGDIIKSLDFNPALVSDSFIIGEVLNANDSGTFQVRVMKSVTSSSKFNMEREGSIVNIPHEMAITEFDGRIELVATKEEYNLLAEAV